MGGLIATDRHALFGSVAADAACLPGDCWHIDIARPVHAACAE